jgi:hypothetical protein
VLRNGRIRMEEISTTKITICIISLILSTFYKWTGAKHRTNMEFWLSFFTSASAIFLMMLLCNALNVIKEWAYVCMFVGGLSGRPFIKMICDKLEEYVKAKYPPEDPRH